MNTFYTQKPKQQIQYRIRVNLLKKSDFEVKYFKKLSRPSILRIKWIDLKIFDFFHKSIYFILKICKIEGHDNFYKEFHLKIGFLE